MSFRNPFFPANITVTPQGGTMPISAAAALGVKTNAGDSVTQTGAATTLAPPAGTPTAATRSVSASSQATASVTGTGSATLVAAPGVGKALELHALIVNGFNNAGFDGGVQLQRIDNNAVLWDSGKLSHTATSFNYSWPYDFQGATLPANVGVKIVGQVVSGPDFSATLVYNVLS